MNKETWTQEEYPTPGAKQATPQCRHWGHKRGEWFYSCCACSGIPNGCEACTDWDVL